MYRIIEPLASRCSKFRFRPLAQVSSEARIQMIANAEGVQTDDGVSWTSNRSVQAQADLQVLQLILELANGDLRKAITYLQTAQRLHGATNPPTPVSTLSSESPFPPTRHFF
jgi:replication factor C subunit 2/4